MDLGANGKRKRGRPSIAAQSEPREERVSKRKRVEPSKPTAAESLAAKEGHVSQDSQPRKRKRGRPSNASVARDEDEREEPDTSRTPRNERVNYSEKRKYGTGSQDNAEEPRGSREKKRVDYAEKRKYSSGIHGDAEEPGPQGTSKKKYHADKGRSVPMDQEVQRVEKISHRAGKKSQVGRPQKWAVTAEQEDEQPNPTSGRASKRNKTAGSKPSATSEEVPDRPLKKRGRPSLTDVEQAASAEVQLASNTQSKRRHRPATSDVNEDEQNQSESGPPKKRRGRPSNTDIEASSSKTLVENGQTRKKKATSREEHGSASEDAQKRKKRRRSSPESEEEVIKKPTEIAHQRLVPKEHKINRDIIDTKWNPLPPGAISRVSSILNEAQRPVMHRLHAEQTRAQAQSAISAIMRKVERKLTKGFPFPPSSTRTSHHREEDFDLEKILKHNRNLENQLTVLHHSNDLLIADRKKEEALLAEEKRLLGKLEVSVKEEKSFNRAELKKSDHPLLKKLSTSGDDKDGIILASKPRVGLSNLQKDEDLEPVIKQIHGHLESMQGNMEQIKDIGSHIVESKAAVEDVLFKHVETAQYERVVLGEN